MPKDLATISTALAGSAPSMRNLNLSYNKLNFDIVADPITAADSAVFMKNLKEFFEHSIYVNHVNFSGMDLLPK